MNLNQYLTEKSALIEKRLSELVSEEKVPYNLLFESARYSLLGGGKRLRPILALAAAETMGGYVETALTPACALEMIHTYSLIHDDLPCMDNDDYRRGKPSLHKAYPEGHAVLTGDFLLTQAFDLLAHDEALTPQQRLELICILSRRSGAHGMIGGQVMDIASEGKKIDMTTLQQMHNYKTGALLSAAVEFGGVLANSNTNERTILRKFGQEIGLAFQIVDDVLDVTVNHGKNRASDQINHKTTYVSLLGLDASKALAQKITKDAIHSLHGLNKDHYLLEAIALHIAERGK